jgi:hypothetical protein
LPWIFMMEEKRNVKGMSSEPVLTSSRVAPSTSGREPCLGVSARNLATYFCSPAARCATRVPLSAHSGRPRRKRARRCGAARGAAARRVDGTGRTHESGFSVWRPSVRSSQRTPSSCGASVAGAWTWTTRTIMGSLRQMSDATKPGSASTTMAASPSRLASSMPNTVDAILLAA